LQEQSPIPGQLRRWQWRADRVHFIVLGIIGWIALAGAHDAGRGPVQATLEGLLTATLYAPFFALCGVKVKPEPRWWKAVGVAVAALWWGLLPPVWGWMLDYWSSLEDALIVGTGLASFWAAILVFGGRERWCTAAAGVCLLSAVGAWIGGLVSLGEASVLGFGGALFLVMLSALGSD
jgi:hypothetical protein